MASKRKMEFAYHFLCLLAATMLANVYLLVHGVGADQVDKCATWEEQAVDNELHPQQADNLQIRDKR
jgi:hypothetical protein